MKSRKVLWIIFDAIPWLLLRRLLDDGSLPAFAGLAERGVFAAAKPPAPNCQTPAAIATLATGLWPREHGVSGFSTPADRSASIAAKSGFDESVLREAPIWQYAASHGQRYAASHLPWTTGPAAGATFAVNGFMDRRFRGDLRLLPGGGRSSFSIGPHVCSAAEVAGHLSLLLQPGGEAVEIPIANSGASLQWTRLDLPRSDSTQAAAIEIGGQIALLTTGSWRLAGSVSADLTAFEQAAGPFVAEGFGRFYRRGAFGPTLRDGGSGDAERYLVETLRPCADYFRKSAIQVLDRNPDAELVVMYQPCIDDIEHELLGWCDRRYPYYSQLRHDIAWSAIRDVYSMADCMLAEVLEHAGKDATVVVSSDHGMAPLWSLVHVNEILHAAGLLAWTPEGKPDLAASSVFYHPANNGSVWLSPNVPHHTAAEVLDRAVQALIFARDTRTGSPLIQRVESRSCPGPGWTPELGDLFVAAAEGLDFDAGPGTRHCTLSPAGKTASHMTNTSREELRGIFLAAGPDIGRPDDPLLDIDNRDIFGFLCEQMQIPVPARVVRPEGNTVLSAIGRLQAR